MIDVDNLRTLVNQDLSRKDHAGGFMSSDEFNRLMNLAQNILFDFFFSKRDEQEARNALSPFYREVRLLASDDRNFTLPTDYNEKLDLWVATRENCDFDAYIPIEIPARNELSRTLSSPVRGPDLNKEVVVGRLNETQLRLWPDIIDPYTVHLSYYIIPPEAERAYTVNPTTDEEELDAANTVNLIWSSDQLPEFVDLMLLFKGLSLRASSLIQWVQAKNVLIPTE